MASAVHVLTLGTESKAIVAGKKRIVAEGARLGIHSWAGLGFQEYYEQMGIPVSFYWRTLDAAPANGIHWMTEDELGEFMFRTDGTNPTAPSPASRDGHDDQDGQLP